MLRFNDGINVDTSGEYRVICLRDGHYVVGKGLMMAVDTWEEGEAWIKKHK